MSILTTLGDSVTAGYGIPTPSDRYVNQLATHYGWTLNNIGSTGSQLIDTQQIGAAYSESPTNTSRYSWLAGYNDMRYYGNDSTALTNWENTFYAGVAWLATLSADKKIGQAASVTKTGSWSNSDKYSSIGVKSSTINDQVSATISGDTIYVVGTKIASGGGVFEVFVDGASKGTYSCDGASSTFLSVNYHPVFVRITGISGGNHSVSVKVVSSGTVYLDWMFGSDSITGSYPIVIVGGPMYMTSAGYNTDSPTWTHGSNAAVDSFNTKVSNVYSSLSTDGLRVYYAPVNSYYNINTDVSADNVHPNTTGHTHLYQAFTNTAILESSASPSQSPSSSPSFSPSASTSSSPSSSASPSSSPPPNEKYTGPFLRRVAPFGPRRLRWRII